MPLTLAQLSTPLTVGAVQTLLLNALQGIGIITQAGASNSVGLGTGSVTYVSGAPNASYGVIIKIAISGEPGVATFAISVDGGNNYVTGVTVPSGSGQYAVGSSGVTIAFTAGPAGSGTSFISGDVYSFALSAPNFPITSWQPGSVYRTLVNIEAQVLSSLSGLIGAMGSGGLANYATGPWCDLVGVNVYNLPRNTSVATVGVITLTDVNSAGPFTVPAGGMYVADNSGHRYINQGSFVIPKGSSFSTPFQAEAPGAAYNAVVGAISTIVVNTLPGVTVTNPNNGTGSWPSTSGVDTETDGAYMSRCVARWPALGPGAVASTYDLWARTGAPNVTRTIVVTDTAIAGQVDVYCAGATGASVTGDVTLANTYIQSRVPLTVIANVVAATNLPITVQTTVTYRSAVSSLAAVQSAVSLALTSFFNSAFMGKDAGGTVKVYLDQIRDVIMNCAGVVNCDPFVSPTTDTALTTGQVATLSAASNVGTTWTGWTFTGI